MIRVVLDTNVIISAHLNEAGLEASVFQLALAKKIEWIVSPAILEEYETVLRRKKFKFDSERVERLLARIDKAARPVEPQGRLAVCPDEADNRFLECTEVAKADYLVTGNARHFPKRWKTTRIVNARELLELIILDLTK